jgi:hypothetical protein
MLGIKETLSQDEGVSNILTLNRGSSIMYGSDLGFISYVFIHDLWKHKFATSGMSVIYLCSLFALFKSTLRLISSRFYNVAYVCLNPMSSWCCGDYIWFSVFVASPWAKVVIFRPA